MTDSHCFFICFFTQTFSSDNEGFDGTSNTGFLKMESDKSEGGYQSLDGNKSDAFYQSLDGNKSDASDKDSVSYAPGEDFI